MYQGWAGGAARGARGPVPRYDSGPMRTLADELAEAAAHPRAVQWVLHLHTGYASPAEVRTYTLFGAPTPAVAGAVAARLHNTMLLLSPAAVSVEVPEGGEALEPLLEPLRGLHKVPVVVGGAPVLPRGGSYNLPSLEGLRIEPPGPGLAAGLDIGGTGMKACVLRNEAPLRAASAPTWPDGAWGVDSLVERARALLLEVAAGERLGSLGIGFAAPMDVSGRVVELSTVLREKVGERAALDGFAGRVAGGIVQGPVAMFNDLTTLGRFLSWRGARRVVRVQLGTSFGGSWIDSNGDVVATEMGRLVVDRGPDARPHPYLPLRGTMRTTLSASGVATELGARLGYPVDPRSSGYLLRGLLDARHPAAAALLDRLAAALHGVAQELHAVLPGVTRVEVGGAMLSGPAGRRLEALLAGRAPVPVSVSARPGEDGAIAAALAPRVEALVRGHKRVGLGGA